MILIETCPRCGHELTNLVIATYPPIPKKECYSCGWSWVGKRDDIIRIPFNDNGKQNNDMLKHESSPCENCPTSIANGGSGICCCILGAPK